LSNKSGSPPFDNEIAASRSGDNECSFTFGSSGYIEILRMAGIVALVGAARPPCRSEPVVKGIESRVADEAGAGLPPPGLPRADEGG
jgi:hypothetical protein